MDDFFARFVSREKDIKIADQAVKNPNPPENTGSFSRNGNTMGFFLDNSKNSSGIQGLAFEKKGIYSRVESSVSSANDSKTPAMRSNIPDKLQTVHEAPSKRQNVFLRLIRLRSIQILVALLICGLIGGIAVAVTQRSYLTLM